MPICDAFRPRIAAKLQRLYGRKSIQVLARLDDVIDRLGPAVMPRDGALYGPQTVMMITYGDQVQCSGRPSLQVLNGFMHEYGLEKVISGIHILPCFPYSSDDGFSVIDYGQIDPALGDWDDIDSLARSFGLMFDFVINHCSKEHEWFQAYLRREAPYTDYFIEADPEADLSALTPTKLKNETASTRLMVVMRDLKNLTLILLTAISTDFKKGSLTCRCTCPASFADSGKIFSAGIIRSLCK